MNYFLIDYENVHCEGIKKLKERNDIKDGDSLIIFFSDKCQNISLDFFDEDFLKGIERHSFKAYVGTPNALDFQLSSYLGYLICTNSLQDTKSDANYYIVANDEGYDCLCRFWKNPSTEKIPSANVSRISTQEEASATATKKKTSKKLASKPKKKASKAKASDATLEEIKEALKDLPKKVLSGDAQLEEVRKIFNENPSKNDIYKELDKKFPDPKHHKKASSIWKKLKPLAKKKNKPGKA